MAAEDDTTREDETDATEITAPSVGPHTSIEHEDPQERLARHEQSDTDALGLDKRREVMGSSYGPSFRKQATLYAGVLAIIVALVVGVIVLVGQFDKSPESYADEAPWSDPGAEQTPVEPLE